MFKKKNFKNILNPIHYINVPIWYVRAVRKNVDYCNNVYNIYNLMNFLVTIVQLVYNQA